MKELLELNDRLLNAPAGVIVMLFAIALGYVLKASSFPNQRIPLIILLATAMAFPLVQYSADGNLNRIAINALIGFILGFLAWAFHAKLLKRFIDPRLFSTGNTQQFNNPQQKATKDED